MYLFLIKKRLYQNYFCYITLKYSTSAKKHFTITVVLRSFRFRSYIYQKLLQVVDFVNVIYLLLSIIYLLNIYI